MDLLKNPRLNSLSHDLIVDGSQSFYGKILSIDYDRRFFVEPPYPLESHLHNSLNNLKGFLNCNQYNKQRKLTHQEFKKNQEKICDQSFCDSASLPNFFLDYMDTKKEYDYGFNISYGQGVLEKFDFKNEEYLILPTVDNYLKICNPTSSSYERILEWQHTEPILQIKHLNYQDRNCFLVRGQNKIHLVEIDDEFEVEIILELNSKFGFLQSASNHQNTYEVAVMDTTNKLKIFNIETSSISSHYNMDNLMLNNKPRIIRFDYLDQNSLMIMNDKQIKLIDTRCKKVSQSFNVNLKNCDILLNFTLNKEYFSNTVYFVSKHSFFIHDIRNENANDFIQHNLVHPPCFINYFENEEKKLATLFSQSPKERAIFGIFSPYSLPYHMSNLEDTYDKCKSRNLIPVIPDIEKRLNYPLIGVQIIPHNKDIAIYYSNIIGELFKQNISLTDNYTEEPVKRMSNWLLQVNDQYNADLNIVHMADASAAFNVKTNELNPFNKYNDSKIEEFLEDGEFDIAKYNTTDIFNEIWDNDFKNNLDILLDSQSTTNKVDEWIKKVELFNEEELD